MFDANALLRTHLQKLVPYSSARDDYKGNEGVFLDANENPLGSITEEDWNRYPDPYQKELKTRIAQIKGVRSENIFLGNGSDEPIDLLFRAFCEPGKDNVIINPPTYGMYKVSADINNVEAREVLLTANYDLDVEAIKSAVDENTKIIFICSPNNPTGNDVSLDKIEEVLRFFKGIVLVDEAYVDFTSRQSFALRLEEFPNLLVLQTFSKAWGLAALRLGMAFASEEILAILNKIKAPYNLSGLVQKTVLKALENLEKKDRMVDQILKNRESLGEALKQIPMIKTIFPTDSNFFLVKLENASEVYKKLIEQKIILRDRSKVALCEGGIRITVGTEKENELLIEALKNLN
ncbi:histidinol phosphate aminotransferase [Roseivirga seohaensis subsp. aquiponti]|uniref:Histidinol-phosphate aminotransferase n=1 Tax=Roseivirga seohaensis subsp. aquiponti TaxID=1566026 RepID=A0A0L8AIT9_9BACT|nr:histidinol-phosphate transaminase [Roseivirga seohaensis]KOF02055.1 histidinol phosphate aminotransferase [Roseivirga seohaensis subsp. aquiponti]